MLSNELKAREQKLRSEQNQRIERERQRLEKEKILKDRQRQREKDREDEKTRHRMELEEAERRVSDVTALLAIHAGAGRPGVCTACVTGKTTTAVPATAQACTQEVDQLHTPGCRYLWRDALIIYPRGTACSPVPVCPMNI